MNTGHRYIFEKGSKKHRCPECGKKTWVIYIDTDTGNYLPQQYGRCDRESKCGYFLNPYKDGYAKAIWEQERDNETDWKPQLSKPKKTTTKTTYFDYDTFKQTLQPDRYNTNTFIQNLLQKVPYPFEVEEITKVVEVYRLGTITYGYRTGAITFPFIDLKGNVRAIQVKQFDEKNHTTGTDFLHSMIEKHHSRNNKKLPEWLEAYKNNNTKVSCLFGEHLLRKYPNNPIALVEAPKTAVYGTLYFGFPEQPTNLLWLAVYNKSSFSFDKLKVLKGRFVYVFPDLSKDGNTFKEWETKAKEYENRLPETHFIFSDLLEQLAPQEDKEQGKDIADYLITKDWRLFRKQDVNEPPKHEPKKINRVPILTQQQPILNTQIEQLPRIEVLNPEPVERLLIEQSEDWSNDITELETYFTSIELPTQPIILNKWNTINDCTTFIETHFATVKANNGKRTFLPYLNRLKKLHEFLNTQQ